MPVVATPIIIGSDLTEVTRLSALASMRTMSRNPDRAGNKVGKSD
ncbi:MAG: hypothetical protein R6V59_06675 [Dehalococcoidia bacterium]